MDKIEYVNGFLFSNDYKKIVLLRKNRPDWQKGKLNGIGGRIESGEKPIDAMKREFSEEAGIEITDWHHFATLEGDTWVVYFYTAVSEDFHKAYSKTDEEIEIHWVFDIPNIDIIPNLKWLIPMSIDPDNIFSIVVYQS